MKDPPQVHVVDERREIRKPLGRYLERHDVRVAPGPAGAERPAGRRSVRRIRRSDRGGCRYRIGAGDAVPTLADRTSLLVGFAVVLPFVPTKEWVSSGLWKHSCTFISFHILIDKEKLKH